MMICIIRSICTVPRRRASAVGLLCWTALVFNAFPGSGNPLGAQPRKGPKDEGRQSLKVRFAAGRAIREQLLVHSHWRYTATEVLAGKERKSTGEFYIKGDNRQQIHRSQPDQGGKGSVTVTCVTSSRWFELHREAEDDHYAIAAIGGAHDKKKQWRFGLRAKLRINIYVCAAMRLYDAPVQELLQDSTAFKAVRTLDRDGHEYVEARFEFEAPNNYQSATLVLAPAFGYAVREWTINLRTKTPGAVATRKGAVVLQRLAGGQVVPKSVRIIDHSARPDAKPFDRVREMIFDEVSLDAVEDAQFTLGAFGLPDTSFYERRRPYPLDRWYFWRLVAVAVLGWLYLRERSRREAGAA